MAAGGVRLGAMWALLGRAGGAVRGGAAAGVARTAGADRQNLGSTRDYSNYAKSPFVERIKDQYEYEVIKNPPEWKYVEQLLPFDTIPAVKPKAAYPSGWIPPREEALNLPFYIARTKNHQLPVYLALTLRGARKISHIKKIEGDIWLMNTEIKAMLKTKYGKYIETRVHEFTRSIEVKGDYVIDIQNWAYVKGF